MVTYVLQQKDGFYYTEPILNEEDWYRVLLAADNAQHRRQLDVLRMFLYQTGHKSTCARLSKLYSMSGSSINSFVRLFGEFAQKNCGKEFRIESPEIEEDRYWPITMTGRRLKGGLFEWELRPELVKALQHFLLAKMLKEYRGPVITEGLNNSRSEEIYKWEIINSVQ